MDIKEVKKKLGGQFSFMFDFINSTVKDLELHKDARILDVGTGQGRMAIILALNNYKVITGEPEGDDPEYAQQDWLANAKRLMLIISSRLSISKQRIFRLKITFLILFLVWVRYIIWVIKQLLLVNFHAR